MVSLVLRKNRSQPRREEGRGSVDRGGFAGKRTNVCHAAGVWGNTAWPGNSAGAWRGAPRVELRSRSGDRLWRTLCIPLAEAAAAAKSLQSCPTLCDPIDGSPSGSSVPGILQARILEWVAISLSNAWQWKVKVKALSRVWLLATPWTAAYQAPPSMGFSRQEYWSGSPFPSPFAKESGLYLEGRRVCWK